MRHSVSSKLVHVPARMDRAMIARVNKRREREGHSWSFVILRLLSLYISYGDDLWKNSP